MFAKEAPYGNYKLQPVDEAEAAILSRWEEILTSCHVEESRFT